MNHAIATQHDYLKTIGCYLDNNFYIISAKRAGMLCKPFGVPRHGYERLIEHNGLRFVVARTRHADKLVWTVRPN